MSAIFEWVDAPGALGDFVWQRKYYFFEGWTRTSSGWKRIYQWGPVQLNAGGLQEQQRQLFASVKPGGSFDYAGVHVWEQAVGGAGWHWAPVTYRTAPGVNLEAGQAPSAPIPDPPREGDVPPLPDLSGLFGQMRKNISSGWDAAVRAYNQSAETLSTMGAAFSTDDVQRMLDLKKLGQVVDGFLADALSGKREVGYDAQGNVAIQALAGDEFRVEVQNGAPVVVDAQTGRVVHGAGTVGFDPVTITAVVVVGAVALSGVYLCVTAIDAAKTWIHAREVEVALAATGCGKPGGRACTPEEVAKMTTAIHQSQKELEQASKSNFLAEAEKTAGSILKTVLWVGAAGAAIYVGAQVIPPLLRARAAVA